MEPIRIGWLGACRDAIPVLAYDTIRFMPSATGGARTHIACSPYEHGMFRGDWLLYGRVTKEFEGLFEPWE